MPHGHGPVRVEVTEIREGGTCPFGLQVGRQWEVASAMLPEGMCMWAFNTMLPFLSALRFGGDLPWGDDASCEVVCPDPANPVVFRLTRLER